MFTPLDPRSSPAPRGSRAIATSEPRATAVEELSPLGWYELTQEKLRAVPKDRWLQVTFVMVARLHVATMTRLRQAATPFLPAMGQAVAGSDVVTQ